MKQLPLLFLLILSFPLLSQVTFQKTYGTPDMETNYCTFTDGGGTLCHAGEGYWMTGSTSHGASMLNALVIRTDANGDTLWTRILGDSTHHDHGNSIQPLSDGGCIVSIYGGPTGLLLVKLDAAGNTVWTRSFNNNQLNTTGVSYHAIETSDGGIAFLGDRYYGAGNSLMSLFKLDASGNFEWGKMYSLMGTTFLGVRFIQLSDHGFCITGMVNTNGGDAFLIRTDSTGSLLWTKNYGTADSEYGYDLKEIQGGIVMVASDLTVDMAITVIKVDMNGNVLNAKTFGDNLYQGGVSLICTNDKGYAIGGYSAVNNNNQDDDGLLLKLDSALNIQWAKTYGAAGSEYFLSALQAPDGGFTLFGYTNSFGAGNYDMYLVKTDANGNCGCYSNVKNLTATTLSPIVTNENLSAQSFTAGNPCPVPVTSGLTVTSLCSNVGIAEQGERSSFSIFPNPAGKTLHIATGLTGKKQVALLNVAGQIVWRAAFEEQETITLPDLPDGIYMAEMYSGEKFLGAQQVVITGK